MADQIMTGDVELEALRPELWSSAFYPTLLEALPFNEVIAKDYQGDIQALGNTVNISSFPQFDEAETIAEDQKVDADAVTATQTQLVINKQVVKDFIITNRAQVQTLESANALRDLAFHSIMKKMQSIIIAAIVPSPSAPDHTIAYATPGTLALVDILAAKELLDASDVPDDGSRQMVLGAPAWNDIFNITGFTSRDFVPAGSPLSSGSLPAPILGFNAKLTTEAGSVSYLFHPMFMQMAVQKSLDVRMYDQGVEGRRSMRVNSTLLFGVVQVSNLRVVTIS
jgi:hypothetical protein